MRRLGSKGRAAAAQLSQKGKLSTEEAGGPDDVTVGEVATIGEVVDRAGTERSATWRNSKRMEKDLVLEDVVLRAEEFGDGEAGGRGLGHGHLWLQWQRTVSGEGRAPASSNCPPTR